MTSPHPAQTDSGVESGRVSVEYSGDGRVATVFFDRERKLNALTLPALIELHRQLLEVESSDATVVVIRTAGEKVFCVGADINDFAGLSPATMWRRWVRTGHLAFNALAGLRQPTVAVVDGLALGGGFELALACDFRILADTAVVGLPETGLGTIPGWGGTERLTELVGRTRAKDVILSGRRLDAVTALDWGLATRVVAPAALNSAVDDYVAQLLRGAPVANQLAKQLINAAADGAPSSVLEPLASALTAATSDLAEGIAAFRQKRAPAFTGN